MARVRALNLIGQRFGRLLVVANWASSIERNKGVWLCHCDCGQESIVRVADLRNGHTKSCGCYHREIMAQTFTFTTRTHGHTRTGTYRSWQSMRQRCTNPKHGKKGTWEQYGGRGIRVCERWNSFENFLADMGERPAGTTIDRYPNVDGNYEPGNCRWADAKQQRANQKKAA